jgi:hypothetical protein
LGLICLTLGACGPPALNARLGTEIELREVTVRVTRPPTVNLYDRGVKTLGVVDFEGPAGAELARRLAAQIENTGAFRVLGPDAVGDRLMKAGLAIGWEAPGSALRWVSERTSLDAVVVGRVEVFRVEGREKEEETLTLQRTGEYGFVFTEEGKLAYRERLAYRSVPLFCRADHGAVAASYRIWDARQGEEVATLRRALSAEMSSFCYRGDVPERLKIQAQDRLLRKLFRQLNEGFLGEIVPRTESTQLAFEVLPRGTDAVLLHRNELGILYASRGQLDRAIEMWEDCLLDRPEIAAVHYNLAMVFRATGRLSLALSHLRKAIALASRPVYRASLAEMRELLAGEGA